MRVLIAFCAASCALAFHGATVHAQAAGATSQPEFLPDDDADRDARARTAFEQGRAAYEAGDYRGAWKHFHDSYELSPHAELLYNIGQTADRLRMDKDAVTAFKLYLERLPKADNRREVENRVRALEERMQQEGTNGDIVAPSDMQDAPAGSEASTLAPPASDQPTRTEWYFRAALGAGLRRDGISDNGSFEATASGVGAAAEFSAGLTMMPGVVLGGGLFFDWTTSPSLTVKGGRSTGLDSANLTMLGPMIDWYLSPQVDGWHAQGALALASLSFSPKGAATGTNTATGAALLLGGGYEWTLASAVGVGALGRLTLASVGKDPYSHGVVTFSALCSFTWY